MVYSRGSISTLRPNSRHVFDVIGPIDATATPFNIIERSSGPSIRARFLTVEDDVNEMQSTLRFSSAKIVSGQRRSGKTFR